MAPRKSTMKRKNGKKLRGGVGEGVGGLLSVFGFGTDSKQQTDQSTTAYKPTTSQVAVKPTTSQVAVKPTTAEPQSLVNPSKPQSVFNRDSKVVGGKKHRSQKKSKTQKKKR